MPVIAEAKVRFVGEPVAVVLASDPAAAEDGRDAIALDIEQLPPVVERHAALAGSSLLFDETGSNVAIEYTATAGDADAAFAGADWPRLEAFSPCRAMRCAHGPRGLLAVWEDGRMVVRAPRRRRSPAGNIVAQLLGLPETAVDMIELDVGGGFGARGEFYPEDFLIPFVARFCGRPVKWTEDRRDHMMTSNHARDIECELEIACTRDGTITGLRGRAICDVGAYIRTAGLITPRNVAMFLSGPYRVPNYHATATVLLTNKTPSGTYRGPGRFELDFCRERLFDMVARISRIHRIAFRRRNLVTKHEMPYKLPSISPSPTLSELDSGDYQSTLDRCLAEFNWTEKAPLQSKLIDGWYHGLAVGCFVEGGAAGPKETARLRVESDGTISLFVGSAAIGQGLETVCLQIAADALDLPMDRINVYHGSTTYLDEGFGAYHSRSVVMGGSAILDAAENLKKTISHAAGRFLNCAPAEGGIAGGMVKGPSGRTIAWSDLAPVCRGRAVPEQQTYLRVRHARCAHRRRPSNREHQSDRLRRDRGCRPDHQSFDAARSGGRLDRPGPRRRAPRTSDL